MERKHEIENLKDQLSKSVEENASKSIELRNLQMDLGRVNSELSLSQRESDERSCTKYEVCTDKNKNEINFPLHIPA